MGDLPFGVKITADGKQLVGEVKASREEIDKLGASAQRAAQHSKEYWADQQRAANASAAAWLKGNAAADAAADKAWALANGYKEVGGLIVKSGAESAKAAQGLGLNTQFARREMMLLGKEALTGDFGRMPRTFSTLVTHSNLLQAAISPIGLAVTGVTAVLVAGAFAWNHWENVAVESAEKTMDAIRKAHNEARRLAGMNKEAIEDEIASVKGVIKTYEAYASQVVAGTDRFNWRASAEELRKYNKEIKDSKLRLSDLKEALGKQQDPLAGLSGDMLFVTARFNELTESLNRGRISQAEFAAGVSKMYADLLPKAEKLSAAQGKKQKPFDPEGDFWFAVDEAAMESQKKKNEKWLDDLVKAQDQANKEMQNSALKAQGIIADIDPIYKAQLAWEDLSALVDAGLLSAEQAGASYEKTFAELDKSGTDAFKSLEHAVRGWGNEFTDEMTRMVRTGKMSFSSLADSIINDLLRIQIQKNITDPLIKGATGFFDGLFTANAAGGLFGGTATGMAGFSSAQLAGPIMSFDGGGYTGAGSRSGGLDGLGGFPAILHPNETVTDHTRSQGSSAPNVVVNVINQSGQPVEAKQQGGPQFDGRDWVLGVVLEAADSNPGFRNAMGIGAH